MRWRDLTGQNRPESVEDADAQDCQAQNIPSPLPAHLSEGEWQELWGHMKACMADKGWEPVAQKKSN